MSAVAVPKTEPKTFEPWPAVMSLETAAKYIDRSYDTLWLMVKRMEIPAVRHGKRVFVRKVDLDNWIEAHLV